MFSRSTLFLTITCCTSGLACSDLVGADFDDVHLRRNGRPSAEDAVLENVIEGTEGNTLQLLASDPDEDPLEYYLASDWRSRASVDARSGLFSYQSEYGAWTAEASDEYRYGVRDRANNAEATISVRLLPAGPHRLVPPEKPSPKFSSPEGRYYFGADMDFDADRVIVGATYDGAYVMQHQANGTWKHDRKIDPPDADAVRRSFGFQASLHGDWALVGAYGAYEGGALPGKAYFYKWNGDTEQYELVQTVCAVYPLDCDTVLPQQPVDRFGWDVALSDSVAAIAAKDDSEFIENAGAVYVYELENARWRPAAKLTAGARAEVAAYFGSSIALDGDMLAVGAEGTNTTDDGGASESGAAYVFDSWRTSNVQPTRLPVVPQPSYVKYRMGPVALSANRLLLGAPGANEGAGLAFVIERENGSWGSPYPLEPPGDSADARAPFGHAVALNRELAVVTRRGAPDSANGGAFTFRREIQQPGPRPVWLLRQRWVAGQASAAGWSVAVDGMTMIVGAPHASPQAGEGTVPYGEIYAFHVPPQAGVRFHNDPLP